MMTEPHHFATVKAEDPRVGHLTDLGGTDSEAVTQEGLEAPVPGPGCWRIQMEMLL